MDRKLLLSHRCVRLTFLSAVLTVLAAAVYLPVFSIGFLHDDFLDLDHSFSPRSFTGFEAGGYRPLMVGLWTLDAGLYGPGRPWGWHLTNLVLFMINALLVHLLLREFGAGAKGSFLGTALFLLSWAAAPAVARVSGRTTLAALAPLLAALLVHLRAVKRAGGLRAGPIFLAQLLFFVSLLFKETAIACPPVFAALALYHPPQGRRKAVVVSLAAAMTTLAVYLLMRFSAVGLSISYAESGTFGLFTVKSMLRLSAMVFKPWLAGVPFRVLLPCAVTVLWLLRVDIRHKMFFIILTVCLLLPVGSLGARGYLAVTALPSAALLFGLLMDRAVTRTTWMIAVPLLLGGFLSARDEVRIIRDASAIVEETTHTIHEVLDSIPGEGPVFFTGIKYQHGDYSTFWEGELLEPLRAAGYDPGRYVGDASGFWGALLPIARENPGTEARFAHLETGRVLSFSPHERLSVEIPDTLLFVRDCLPLAEFGEYSDCIVSERVLLYLQDPFGGDSLIVLVPDNTAEGYHFFLEDRPEWVLASEGSSCFFSAPVTAAFSRTSDWMIELESEQMRKEQMLTHYQ